MILKKFFRQDPFKETASTLYAAIMAQARQPVFYTDYGVPDTPEGRYELLILHAFLVFHRLKSTQEKTRETGQAVFDLMFTDIEMSLRETGVGDMGIPHRVKALAKAFYGRAAAYDEALEQEGSGKLRDAIARNFVNDGDETGPDVKRLRAYLLESVEMLAAQATDQIISGTIHFPAADQVDKS
jgi:cytochrome b pre-mRNA-processing protein 3